MDVEGGSAKVTEGGEALTCSDPASDETFQRIVAGELNPTTAYMTGKLKVSGDMAAALKLQNLF